MSFEDMVKCVVWFGRSVRRQLKGLCERVKSREMVTEMEMIDSSHPPYDLIAILGKPYEEGWNLR
jgi:hypothetical protein